MNISAFSIKNPLPIIMFFCITTLLGVLAFNGMKIQNFPDISFPTITIAATLPGATPAQLETDVAKKLENTVAPLEGLKKITTRIHDGSVLVILEFKLDKPLQQALDEVRSSVSEIRSSLPTNLLEPVINEVKLSNTPILTYTIKSPTMNIEQLSWYVDNELTKRMLSIPGIGSIQRVGGVTREVQILIDSVKIKSLEMSAGDISRQLKEVQTESSGGRMEIGNSEQPIRAIATVNSAEDLKNLELMTASGIKVKLNEIATIADTYAQKRTGAYLNGQSVVGFEITRSKGASEVEVAKLVSASLEQLKKETDFKIQESFNFVEPVANDYHASITLLLEGALLAIFVVWLFLRDIRATLVSAIALPLSIMPAFIMMYNFGFSINVVTLLALSLVVGILVDDAIVEVENIERHINMGKTPYQAAMEATQEIGLAVVATTLALVAVFLPTAFLTGIPGLFFKQFGWTAALAVFASLVVARLLTPLMAAYVMKKRENYTHKDPFWMRKYLVLVKWCIFNRFKTATLAGLFFIGSLALIPLLPTGFMPADNLSQTQVSLELEPGTTFEQTQKTVEQARLLISKMPSVISVYTTIGAGSSGAQPLQTNTEVTTATLTLKLKPKNERPVRQILENQLREVLLGVPGVRVKIGSGAAGEKYILSLSGDDSQVLMDTSIKIEKELSNIPNIGSVSSSSSLNRTEVAIKINYSKAAELGITTQEIADTVRVATLGDYDKFLSKLTSSSRQIPIVVRLDSSFTKNIESLKSLDIKGKNAMIPLSEIADISFISGPAVIERFNRSRNINIEVELATVPLGVVTKTVEGMDSVKNLPAGVHILPIGDTEIMNDLFTGFSFAMLTGVICIYLILVLLFKDMLQPITILAALPLSLGGAFVALLLTGQSFSMPSLIGLIMLMGVATKNSILLVEYAIVAKNEGMNRLDAMVDACHKRARPIVMTTIAMGAGMLPIAFQWGSGDGSFRAPMAIAVIGGLITSTFLSLLVIPAVFTFIDDIGVWLTKIIKKD